METLLAIHTRQSTGNVLKDPIPDDLIEKLLSAAVQAPNHYKVRPWRFFVITGSGLEKLGDAMAASLAKKTENLPVEALEKEKAKPLRAPLIIAVAVDKPADTRVVEIENVCAAAAACQNILLAAHTLGLAGIWRTGPAATDPLIKEFLGLETGQHLISFLYIGFPEKPTSMPERPTYQDRTNWVK